MSCYGSSRIRPAVAFQTFDYKLSSFIDFRVGGEAAEAEADGGVGLVGGEAAGARRTCEGSGMPEGQAEPVEAAEVGLEGGEQILGDKAFKSQVGIAGVSAVDS